MTTSILFFISGLIIGAIIAWLLAVAHRQRQSDQQISDIQSSYANQITELEKSASGAGARVEELRQQVQQKDLEIEEIRNELDIERELKNLVCFLYV